MIPDAAVSYFDKHCLSQKFGGKYNLQGVNGSRKRRDYNCVKLKTECISRLVVPRRCFFQLVHERKSLIEMLYDSMKASFSLHKREVLN